MPKKTAETGANCTLISDVILLLQKVEIKNKNTEEPLHQCLLKHH